MLSSFLSSSFAVMVAAAVAALVAAAPEGSKSWQAAERAP